MPPAPKPRHLVETAIRARANQTRAQDRLWELVRDKRLGPKFRRQHPMVVDGVKMVVDFVSLRSPKVAIETGTEPMDPARARRLSGAGFQVLWFHDDYVSGGGFPEVLRASLPH